MGNSHEKIIFDSVPAMIWFKDHKNNILRVNRLAAESIGLPIEQIEGRSTYDLYPEEGFQYHQDDLEVISTGKPKLGIVERYQARSGEKRWVRTDKIPYRDEAETVIGVIVFAVDITDQKRAEEALQRMNETLEQEVQERTAALLQKQEELRSLAFQLSRTEERERKILAVDLHDNLAQLLALSKMKVEVAQQNLKYDRLPQTLQDIRGLLNDALQYTRTIMSDLRPLLLGDEQDLNSAILWVVEKVKRHGLVVTVRDDGERKPLDEEMLVLTYRALQELLWNVLKHAHTKKATVSLRRAGEYLQVWVVDKGDGFEVSVARPPSKQGGFGLFSIRERLELIGGAFKITSRLKRGTCVKLLIPLKSRSQFDPTQLKADTELRHGIETQVGTGSKIQVLVVDDHGIMREGLRSIIESQPDLTVVAEASDGQMAVDMARQFRPDVIVMDVNMPKMNGVEATRKIKAEFSEIFVVALSVENMALAMFQAGASAYVSKCGSFKRLCSVIREGLKAKRKVGRRI